MNFDKIISAFLFLLVATNWSIQRKALVMTLRLRLQWNFEKFEGHTDVFKHLVNLHQSRITQAVAIWTK